MEQRLFVISGKGGVGKTIFSLALAQELISKGKKVVYNHFDQEPLVDLCRDLKIPLITLNDEECLKAYISKKLGSKLVSSWLIKAPFFHSLFNILPGLKNLVYLGYLLNLLREDPDLVIVLDSPSSGHALTLFESPSNFREILKKGPLVNDILVMEKLLQDKNFTKLFILFLPSIMAFHEAEELREGFIKLKMKMPDLVLNGAFSKMDDLGEALPGFLKEKFKHETLVLDEYEKKYGPLKKILPYIPKINKKILTKNLAYHIGEIL